MKHVIAFILGAAIGSIVTWQILDKKYLKLAQDEIDSVKERFSMPKNDKYIGPQDSDEAKNEKETKYEKVLGNEGYSGWRDEDEAEPDEDDEEDEPCQEPSSFTNARGTWRDPYVIPPENFGELDDYTTISLMYFIDGTLADDNDEIIDNIEDTVPADFADHFGEFDDDVVYVRNERLKVDYEILRSLKAYWEVLRDKPYLGQEE